MARSGMKKDFVVIGGLANNAALIGRVEGILQVSGLPQKPGWDPAMTVALGAALFAAAS